MPLRSSLVALALLVARPALAAPPDDTVDRLTAALTPPLAAVLRPLPPLPSGDQDDKLAFMAELGRRIDRRDGHSDSRAWKKIMHWPEPGDTLFTLDATAPDTSPSRYPVPQGRVNRAVDFAASVALGWLDTKHFSCDFPLRARYLADHGLIPTPTPFEAGRCTRFERWADLGRVEAVEVVYVTPSWNDASASMGHVVFRIRHSGAERVTGESFEPVFAYTAIEVAEETEWYVFKGLTGGLTTTLRIEAMGNVYRRYGIREARDLVLYELALDRRELRYLLGEVYAQAEQETTVPYAFLSVNCASLAYDLMQSVLPELPERSTMMAHPHEVVSMLLEAGRARPKGILPSRYTRAALAEGRLDDLRKKLSPAVRDIPGLLSLHRQRTAGVEPRSRALAALDAEVAGKAFDATDAETLAAYIDGLIDVETWAIDVRLGKADPSATSPVLDRALDVRARLPMIDDPRILPLEPQPLLPAGSRKREIGLGMIGQRPLMRLRLAVLEEATGEPRAVLLRRGGRTTVLRSETAFSVRDGEVRLEEERVVIFDSATWSLGPETELGWWGSRTGFHLAAETLTRPGDDLDFAMRVRGGLGLTLLASPDFADHLVVGVTFEGSTWSHGDADLHLGAGPFVEAGVALGPQRLRFTARALPGWSFPAGFGWSFEGGAGLDLVLDRAAGVVLALGFAARFDMPIPDAWELTMGLSW